MASYPMELDSEVSHQIWVFNAFKYFQLICRLLDCFVIIWLKPDLVIKTGKSVLLLPEAHDYL